jgi:hypothetical protein
VRGNLEKGEWRRANGDRTNEIGQMERGQMREGNINRYGSIIELERNVVARTVQLSPIPILLGYFNFSNKSYIFQIFLLNF